MDFEQVACEAARRGGRIAAERFRSVDPVRVEAKGLHDFVTEVDRQAEAAIVAFLHEKHPDHVVMAEEGSPDASRAPWHKSWTSRCTISYSSPRARCRAHRAASCSAA